MRMRSLEVTSCHIQRRHLIHLLRRWSPPSLQKVSRCGAFLGVPLLSKAHPLRTACSADQQPAQCSVQTPAPSGCDVPPSDAMLDVVAGDAPRDLALRGVSPQRSGEAPCSTLARGASPQRSGDVAPAPLRDAPMPSEHLGASPQQSGNAPWRLRHQGNAYGVDDVFDIPGLQMVHETLAQEAMLASVEPELEAHPSDPGACAREREVADAVPTPRAEGTGMDDGVMQLAFAPRALRRAWRRLCPCDLDYFDLSVTIRSGK